MAERISDGVLVIDGSGKILHMNSRARALAQRHRSGPAQLSATETLPPELGAWIEAARQRMGSAETPAIAIERIMLSKPAEAIVARAIGRESEMVVLLSDEAGDSRERYLEQELLELRSTMEMSLELQSNNNAQLNQSLEELERLNAEMLDITRIKSEFVANTSHELRTPLNSVIGSLQLIVDGLCEDDEERELYLAESLSSARRLLALINDMLDVSKIDAGMLTLEVGEHEIQPIFDDLYEKYGHEAQRAGLKLSFAVCDPNRTAVRCDRERLNQLLSQLISNAIKFTPEGSVSVTLASYPGDAENMVVSVQDTGIGIPHELHDKVFEMFVQGDGSSRRKFDGTGLGLALSKRLAESMGGHIWIVKGQGECGTTFSFTLPAAGPEAKVEDPDPVAIREVEQELGDSF